MFFWAEASIAEQLPEESVAAFACDFGRDELLWAHAALKADLLLLGAAPRF